MLASKPSPPLTVPVREQSHIDVHQSSRSDSLDLEDRLCPGCKKSAVSEQGGLVVAFGQSFFHVDCFKCAKCSNQVTADTNLLLLSDGSPICANCSYNCNICHLPILDEAIMTGDDSYHAHCFKCKVCKNRIDELVFAKTSQGIYCMKCHNERMIKIRKYTQKKAERERNGVSGSSKTRDRDARAHMPDSGGGSSTGHSRPSSSRSNGNLSTTIQQDASRPSTARSVDSPSAYARPVAKPKGPLQPFNPQDARSPPAQSTLHPNLTPSSMYFQSPAQSPSFPSHPAVTVAPPPENDRPNTSKSSTLPVPSQGQGQDLDDRRRSYDDGVRPLQILFGQKSPTSKNATLRPEAGPVKSEGLTVTSRQEKRRSINPGLVLPNIRAALPSATVHATLSPDSAAFPDRRIPTYSPTPPGGLESPPQDAQLLGGHTLLGRPDSQTSSVHSYHSCAATPTDKQVSRSQSPSLVTQDNDNQTLVVKPSQSRSREPSRSPSPANQPALIQGDGADSRSQPRVNGNGNRLSSTSNLSNTEERGSAVSSRSASPYHQVDVPRGIDDGSDSEATGQIGIALPEQRHALPPTPPPKTDNDHLDVQSCSLNEELDNSGISHPDALDDMSESSPVERTSHATFIAPALPPIRFSLNPGDFAELLSSVSGTSTLKSLDQMAILLQEHDTPTTSPKTSFEPTLTTTTTPSPPPTASELKHPGSHEPSAESLTEERRIIKKSQETVKKVSSENKSLSILNLPLSTPESRPEQIRATTNGTRVVVTDSGLDEPRSRQDVSDSLTDQLRESIKNSQDYGAKQVHLAVDLVETVIAALDSKKAAYDDMKEKFDGMKRTSKNFIDGVLVAQVEYDKEQKARRDAEAEVTRLRVLLSGQVAKLTAMSGDDRRHELRQQMSKELHNHLAGLEHDLSRLKLERDIAMAEVEELSSAKSLATPEKPAVNLGRSVTKRLDNLRKQYQRDLIPLTEERETLSREIVELKAVRDVFLEETTALNARNEELAQLSHIYARRLEAIPEVPIKHGPVINPPTSRPSFERLRNPGHTPAQSVPSLAPSLSASTSGSSATLTIFEEFDRSMKPLKQDQDFHTSRKLKWPGSKTKPTVAQTTAHELNKSKSQVVHNFQQVSVLRLTRCDHCGDKLFGSQLRCTLCNASIHARCVAAVQLPCAQHRREDSQTHLMPSMFGRDLIEQVSADSRGDDRQVPIIVDKCIQAVEAIALDYEGIYRKTGGHSQSKTITQLFERGDYTTFDLLDTDRFNDICSVTSVLKNYFRSLPNPLLTFELYDQFVNSIAIKDLALRDKTLFDLVKQLPSEHYYTLRALMIHLHHIHERKEKTLMNARNLGVVFGPTLIRSPDSGAEFADMAQRALFVEWLVENTPQLFKGAA